MFTQEDAKTALRCGCILLLLGASSRPAFRSQRSARGHYSLRGSFKNYQPSLKKKRKGNISCFCFVFLFVCFRVFVTYER